MRRCCSQPDRWGTSGRLGFTTGDGLHIAFAIERAAYINDNLVTSTRLGLNGADPVGAGAAAAGERLTLVQNGAGNVVQPGQVLPTAAATVIQNTLDSQTIQTLTVIDAAVNSVQAWSGSRPRRDRDRSGS